MSGATFSMELVVQAIEIMALSDRRCRAA